ncbi:hsp90-like protein [Colletotrichum scovillei]|uniref:histidine kinase n=1 Tax=Colletotrichum scovillei TaxID=1209932 RepID=A0A9P7RBH5_9PEZI|nr:hsp90-like protein [Colletotrichum scovillei]KAF4783297.1 hsp90-like protein [Colletotrichum scovillei]KAG7053144.1 hsp90-like protein [Colletotrichum scovillei]KAG7071439.1 hsp90-like protein [Colletotrichum scovillei]KAG7079691.1 hsp90-like protein [Colletotrichum scovillei]
MVNTPPAKAVSESRRERETFRYDSSLIAHTVYNDPNNLKPSSELRSCPDAALTSFAELGALRLNATRAMISLFDSKYQYVVAEATQSLALTPNTNPPETQRGDIDQLLLCGTAIPRSSGICELILSISDHLDEKHPSGPHQLPVTVIPDLSEDPRTSQRAFCLNTPQCRFYAGVPIRSQSGIHIGVFSIYGDTPRKSFDNVENQLMQDISKVILNYLDAKRNRDDHRRADRMVRGVGSFIEGKSTMSGWRDRNNIDSFDDHPFFEGALNKNQQKIERQREMVAFQAFQAQQNQSSAVAMQNVPQPKAQGSEDRPVSPTTAPRPSPSPNQDPKALPSVSGTSLDSIRSGSESISQGDGDSHMSHIRHVFSKAANIVREAIEVESVLFVDASIGSFGGLAGPRGTNMRSSRGRGSSSSSSDEQISPGIGVGSVLGSDSDQEGSLCAVLGFSSSSISSVDGDIPSLSHTSVSEKFLAKLLRRYPEGKIFNFDENGSIQSSDHSGDDHTVQQETPLQEIADFIKAPAEDERQRTKKRKQAYSRRNEGKTLSGLFSGTRSMAIIPLWDVQKQRWYAGGFACTKTPTRVLTIEGELSYLRAFASVVMSEVDHVSSMLVDKAKTDLLSSLSHELRSPLHGIILGAELMHDTTMDAFQGETLVSIENCGRTLLETIDHLLDWSKINNFIGPSKHRRNSAAFGERGLRARDQKISIEAGMMSITSNVEVDVLSEEVVESVCAGFSYQRVSVAQLAGNRPTEHADTTALRRLDSMQAMEEMATRTNRLGDLQLVLGDVSITFDISPAISWGFHTQPGALRRVIMNLLGNSLKYTDKGFVNVNVNQLAPTTDAPPRKAIIQIDVVDSGRGISQEYLQHHLFAPFAQEDSFAAGAGLGLSLVKQIVNKLRGSIQVWSKVGRGTKVRVQLPLLCANPASPTVANAEHGSIDAFRASVSELMGLRVKLIGFPEDYGVKMPDELASNTSSEGALITNLCREWLQMQIIDQSIPASQQLLPDLVLSTEKQLEQLLMERRLGIINTPVVVVCRNALIARQLATSARFTGNRIIFEFISQPIGPRKLAKVLLLSFKRWTKMQERAIPTPTMLSLASPEASNAGGDTPTGRAQDRLTDVGSTEALPEFPTGEDLPERLEELPNTEVEAKQSVDDQVVKATDTEPRPEDIALPNTPEEHPKRPTLEGQDTPRLSHRPKKARGDRPKFLLVDDNPLNLKMLATYMTRLGHDYRNAKDGQEALDEFRLAPGEYHCVLMDISMPVMDGFEATRRIRAIETKDSLSRCLIIALTGLASANAQQEAFASGIDLFLTKPVRLKELSRILESRGIV